MSTTVRKRRFFYLSGFDPRGAPRYHRIQLLRYRFKLAEGFVPQPVGRMTIRSENGMRMVLTRRDGQWPVNR